MLEWGAFEVGCANIFEIRRVLINLDAPDTIWTKHKAQSKIQGLYFTWHIFLNTVKLLDLDIGIEAGW